MKITLVPNNNEPLEVDLPAIPTIDSRFKINGLIYTVDKSPTFYDDKIEVSCWCNRSDGRPIVVDCSQSGRSSSSLARYGDIAPLLQRFKLEPRQGMPSTFHAAIRRMDEEEEVAKSRLSIIRWRWFSVFTFIVGLAMSIIFRYDIDQWLINFQR